MDATLAWLGWAIEVVAGAAAAVLLLLGAVWLIFSTVWLLANRLPPEIRFRLLKGLVRDPFFRKAEISEEHISAARHHRAIGEWVAHRIGVKSVDDLPTDIFHKFQLLTPGSAPPDPFRSQSSIRTTDNLEYRLLMVSLSIFNDRGQYWVLRRKNYRSLQVSTWLTIGIGLITTILVSLSSTEFGRGDAGAAPVLRILAIVFPALGTATAAIIAFYRFTDEMGRTSHTLASLRQLHGQMALEIWSLRPAPADASVGLLEPKLQEWVKRYDDIQAVAEAAAPARGDQTAGPSGDANSLGGSDHQPKPS